MSQAESESSRPVEYVVVVCKTCGTRVDERVADIAREVRCPDCDRPVRIPGRSEVPPRPEHKPAADPGVYALRNEAKSDAAAEERRRKQRDARCVTVVCSTCHARLDPPMRKESYRVRCPDCEQPVRVPSQAEVAARKAEEKPAPSQLEPIGMLPIPAASERRRTHPFFDLQTAHIRREAVDPAPEWVWFTGVWTFPWNTEVLKKWGFFSLGLTMVAEVVVVLFSLFGGVSSPASAVMAFFVLPLVWLFLWTSAYGTSACEHVIAETAAGNRRMHDWPEQGWREGMFSFLPWLYLFGVASLIGHLAGMAGEAAGEMYWPVCLCVVMLLLPYLVLSMLETGAWYAPFSGPVTTSLWRSGRDWLMCYLLIGGLFGGWGWIWWQGVLWSPFVTPLLTGWVWGAVMLISARLLGRLAWRITQSPTE